MKIPKNIKEYVDKLYKNDLIEKEKAKQRKKAFQKKQAIKQKKEDAKKDLKLLSAEYIFSWRKEFLETLEGQIMFDKSNKNLMIFGGYWGHNLDIERDHGCWSRVHIIENGLDYMHGYKWMPAQYKKFKTPEEMINNLNFEYIKLIEKNLKSKKIFEDILKYNKL